MPRLTEEGLDVLFRQARTHSAWLDKPVTDETIHQIYFFHAGQLKSNFLYNLGYGDPPGCTRGGRGSHLRKRAVCLEPRAPCPLAFVTLTGQHARMKTQVLLLCAGLASATATAAPWPQFRHHFISRDLPTDNNGTGDYGLTALVDLNRDGHPDFVLGGRGVKPERLYWFEYRAPDDWVKHEVGRDYQSDVGLAALDVDGDGWPDLVCSGVWFRNPGSRSEQPWERLEFAKNASGAHDIIAADIDGDGRLDVVMMGDTRTKLNALCWFRISKDPRQAWERHEIGRPVHGAIAPAGVADLDGDGDLDVVRADTWFENKDGKGREWIAHKNIPMGRTGPFGVCVRTAIADVNGDGKKEIVMCDADITGSKAFMLRNADGKGGAWEKTELPLSFESGSFHSLAVADLNGDGRTDVIVNEQEELLPEGRTNPRWIAWENLGEGKFAEHILLDAKLGGHELQAADVDGDGDSDLCSKPWGVRPWNGADGRMHVDFLENLLKK